MDNYCAFLTNGGLVTIPGFLAETDAVVFNYSTDKPPLTGTIRNDAAITITNHSGHLGTPFGPEPKASYTGNDAPTSLPTGRPEPAMHVFARLLGEQARGGVAEPVRPRRVFLYKR